MNRSMDIPSESTVNINYQVFKLKPYVAIDLKGKKVRISPKNPAKHKMNHPLETNATVYYNLGNVIGNPSNVQVSKSNNPKALEHGKEGEILIYTQDNFATNLNIPGYSDMKGDVTEVVVLYKNSKKENFTLTYHVKPR